MPSAYTTVQQDLGDRHQGIIFPGISEHSRMDLFCSALLLTMVRGGLTVFFVCVWAKTLGCLGW
jgi:hypothetical protein